MTKAFDKIWLIQYNYWNDDYRGVPQLNSVIDEDYGFFTDYATAEAKCEELNNRSVKDWTYQKMNHEKKMDDRIAAWGEATRQAEVLIAAGFKSVVMPKEPKHVEFASYEFWKNWNNISYYAIVEVMEG